MKFSSFVNNLTSLSNKASKYIKDNTLLVTIVSVSILLCIFISYNLFKINKLREGATNQDDSKAPKQASTILLFSAEWCPHCKKARPNWDEFQSNLPEKVNGYTVKPYIVDCTDDQNNTSKKMMDKFDVSGFPTIILLKDVMDVSLEGQTDSVLDAISNSQSNYNKFTLEASPTTENMLAFVNKSLE